MLPLQPSSSPASSITPHFPPPPIIEKGHTVINTLVTQIISQPPPLQPKGKRLFRATRTLSEPSILLPEGKRLTRAQRSPKFNSSPFLTPVSQSSSMPFTPVHISESAPNGLHHSALISEPIPKFQGDLPSTPQ